MEKSNALPAANEGGGVRVRTLMLTRWLAIGGQTLTIAIVYWVLDYPLPILELALATGMSAVLNLAITFERRPAARLNDQQTTAFLIFDTLQVAALLYLTGGIVNPFAVLLVVPAAIAAVILSAGSVLVLSIITVLSATTIGLMHLPLPARGPAPTFPFVYHLAAWIAVVTATVAVTIYARQLAYEARQVTAALQATSAALAREQRLSALGALAASAAHELGSPLATIAVVAGELRRELDPADPLLQDVDLLMSEADRCRQILQRLSVDPSGDVSEAYTVVSVPALVEAAAEPNKREDIAFNFVARPVDEHAPPTAPVQVRTPEFLQGLGNIIHNAASFARKQVNIQTVWSQEMVTVSVSDDGPGFPPKVLNEIGAPFISTREGKDGHLGLGVFIARNLLERIGATLIFGNRPANKGGGANVEVIWHAPVFRNNR
jgi:two-component system sensor histidine kinase RegB